MGNSSFRERHGHVAAGHAEVVRAVRAVVVGAVALCGRGGEGDRFGHRRNQSSPGLDIVVSDSAAHMSGDF